MMRLFTSLPTLLAQGGTSGNPFGTGDGARFDAPGAYTFEGDGTGSDGVLANIESLLSNIIGFLTVLAAIFFIINFILGAFNWVTAGGDQSKIQQARDKMVNGVIGLIVIVAAYGIIGIIGAVVGIDILNLRDMIEGTTSGTGIIPEN